jgi:MFS family permease
MVNDPTVRVPASTPASAARPTSIRYLVVLLIALCSSSAYLTRYCISVANTTIEADLSLTPEQMGWILAMFNAGYFFFQVPGGALGTRFGTRVSLPLLSTLWSIFTVWTSLVSTYIPLMASRIAFGAAQAGLVPNSAKGVSDWLPIERKGFGSASIGAAMSVGGAVTMGMTGLLLERFDWRTLFQLYSLVGIVWAGGYYLIARSRPGEHPRVNKAELDLIEGRIASEAAGEETSPEETSPKARGLTRVVVVRLARSRNMWFICGQAAFRAAGYGLFVTWFPAFLEKGYGVTREAAGMKTMAPLFGVIVGTMLGGFLVDALLKRTRSKKISRSGVALTALALCGCFTFSASLTASPNQLVAAVAIGAIFSGLGNPAAWAATMDVAGDYTAEVMGVMNMAGTVGAFFTPAILGYMIGDIERSGGDWNQVIYLIAGIYFAGSACWLWIDPNISATEKPAG